MTPIIQGIEYRHIITQPQNIISTVASITKQFMSSETPTAQVNTGDQFITSTSTVSPEISQRVKDQARGSSFPIVGGWSEFPHMKNNASSVLVSKKKLANGKYLYIGLTNKHVTNQLHDPHIVHKNKDGSVIKNKISVEKEHRDFGDRDLVMFSFTSDNPNLEVSEIAKENSKVEKAVTVGFPNNRSPSGAYIGNENLSFVNSPLGLAPPR